jgi:hypothetical protein
MLSTKIEDQGRHDEYAFVLRELLTFELNHVTGRGFSDVQLRTIIINWGEGVLQDNTPAGAGLSPQRTVIGEPGQFPNILTSPLDGTGTITRKSNGSTDGGGTGG